MTWTRRLPPPRRTSFAQPTRAHLFALLSELKRAAGTVELAERLDLHPNGVRVHLERMEEAELMTRERVQQARGRPRDAWTIAPNAESVGNHPAPTRTSAAGWPERSPRGRSNCPYRDVVRENQQVVCTLPRGITSGLLDVLDPDAKLAEFVPRDPDSAGCLIEPWGERRLQGRMTARGREALRSSPSPRRHRTRRVIVPGTTRPSGLLAAFFAASLCALLLAAGAGIAYALTGLHWLHWTALHLALLGGVSQLVVGAGQFFSCAFLATDLALPARLIALAQTFLPAGLILALVVTLKDGATAPFVGPARPALAALLLVGWIGLTVAGSLLHLLAILARVRSFARAIPASHPALDRGLTAVAGLGVGGLALSDTPDSAPSPHQPARMWQRSRACSPPASAPSRSAPRA